MKNKKALILPIHSKKTEILNLLSKNQVIIVVGETGSGKTTQLPQFCLDAGLGKNGYIVITQPRRIAATSTAQRVAEERNTPLGTEVGYRVRFHEKYSRQTRLYFMTDGILLTEIISDRYLLKYQTIIIDEAHERSLNIDFLLGYIKIILHKRPDLKLIISSATIDVSLFSRAFYNAPVVEVSGRLFPVEVIYQPLDSDDLETENYTYVDAAVQAVEDIIELGDPGDILVFMPTERDIMETVRLLTGRRLYSSLILPLFARLTRFQQNRIFYPCKERKIIIATNIAETSITIPGIRFVIDTGFARVSRFVPRLRTNRLPVEPVSQASSDQRKGRCGRIEDGLCIRLYSEEDYLARRKYNIPEIKRSNIAGVILNMLNIKLGNIENFPFLEPPDKRAIKDGFDQLFELGAIDSKRQLTSLGKKMVRLPLEPHISRMIVQAHKEDAQKETIIISAGLSIGDPRERPDGKEEEAKKVHTQFNVSGSDFLTLLRLWETYQNHWKSFKTQNKIRRFCRDHFLSYNRMNEWNDIYQQIVKILKDVRFLKLNIKNAPIDSIHRSVLAGIISNIALKKEKTNSYTATKNREIYIFPGSTLFKQSPQWIMCHEIVETSRVFGRNVAPISPQWIEELAPALCKSTYSEPFYDPDTMNVRVYETVYFSGLPIITNRKITYSGINPDLACEVFIREALVNFQLKTELGFYTHNKQVYKKIETIYAKMRIELPYEDRDDSEFISFYKERLKKISSYNDLLNLIRKKGSDTFLYMKVENIVPSESISIAETHPDNVNIGGKNFSLKYEYSPGNENDGITVKIPRAEISYINDSTFTWIVSSLWEEKITYLLKNLPKQKRKNFIPVRSHAQKIAFRLTYKNIPFIQALCDTIYSMYTIKIDPSDFREDDLPLHLQMRIEIVDSNKKIVARGRNFTELKKNGKQNRPPGGRSFFENSFKKHEINNITDWNFGDIAVQIEIARSKEGFPVYAYPALCLDNEKLNLRLFSDKKEAEREHTMGTRHLLELNLSKEFAWLYNDLKFPDALKLYCNPFGREEKMKESIFTMLSNHFLFLPLFYTKIDFLKYKEIISNQMRGVGYRVICNLNQIMEDYTENNLLLSNLASKIQNSTYKKLEKELYTSQFSYIKNILDRHILFCEFEQFPRYLRAFRSRIEKAFSDTSVYINRMEKIDPYVRICGTYRKSLFNDPESISFEKKEKIIELLLMVEEFFISLFAQQIKTVYPVSEKRIEKLLNTIQEFET